MVVVDGATIEEDTGEISVKRETTKVAVHFLRLAQFFGLRGSSGPSQVTWEV